MLTGPRRGEISALRWRHIDFERGLLSIVRSNAQPKAGVKEKHTKTRPGPQDRPRRAHRRATGCAPPSLGTAPRRTRLGPQPRRLRLPPDGLTPYAPRAISQRYRKLALKLLKLRSTRLHSLRHYSATELVAAGVDIRTVAGRLGHGSGGATTLVYAGWVNEADRRAAETMATIVPRPVPAPTAPRGPYEVIAEALREQIRTGQLKPGDQLPTISCTATEPGLVVVSPLGSSVSGRRGTCGCVR
jgi:integrase